MSPWIWSLRPELLLRISINEVDDDPEPWPDGLDAARRLIVGDSGAADKGNAGQVRERRCDRLIKASGEVEGGDGIVEGRRAVAGAVPGRRVRAHRSKISDQVISPSGAVRRRQAKGWLHR